MAVVVSPMINSTSSPESRVEAADCESRCKNSSSRTASCKSRSRDASARTATTLDRSPEFRIGTFDIVRVGVDRSLHTKGGAYVCQLNVRRRAVFQTTSEPVHGPIPPTAPADLVHFIRPSYSGPG